MKRTPIWDKTPESASDGWLLAYGAEKTDPEEIRTDNGGEFEGCFHAALVKRGIARTFCLPHRPSTKSRI